MIWAAGVKASPLGAALGVEVDRSGRVVVEPDLTIPGHPEVFALGDMAAVDGVPGVAQGALQGGEHVARVIAARLAGAPSPGAFRYKDKGSMATIGRRRAVVDMGRRQLTGGPRTSPGASSTSPTSRAGRTGSRPSGAGRSRASAGRAASG